MFFFVVHRKMPNPFLQFLNFVQREFLLQIRSVKTLLIDIFLVFIAGGILGALYIEVTVYIILYCRKLYIYKRSFLASIAFTYIKAKTSNNQGLLNCLRVKIDNRKMERKEQDNRCI